MKNFLAFAIAAMLTLSLAACGPASAPAAPSAAAPVSQAPAPSSAPVSQAPAPSAAPASQAPAATTLIMGTNAAFPPFETIDANNNIVGFDPALAAEIAKELGMELKIENMEFDLLVGALMTGKIDIILAGMSITEERQRSVDFTQNYFDASQVIIVAGDNTAVTGPDDLQGMKVGVQLATTGHEAVDSMGGMTVQTYESGAVAAMDLVNGKIGAIVLDYYPSKVIVDGSAGKLKMVDNKFTVEEYAAAVAKGSDLLPKVNAALDKIRADGRYDQIVKEYIPE